MSSKLEDSIVLITSSYPKNSSFGTGFIIHRDDLCTYVLTCAHVVNALSDTHTFKVDGATASKFHLGEEDGADLAVLKVEGLQDKPVLRLSMVSEIGAKFITFGFQSFQTFGHKTTFMPMPLHGTLGEQTKVGPSYQSKRIDAWLLKIVGDSKLEDGYSGSPIIDEASRKVLGVLSTRVGPMHGVAIAIEALKEIWLDMPDSLFQDYDSVDHQATAETSQDHFIQYLENLILQMPTQENVLRSISNSFNYYLLQPDCETLANQLNKMCAPFLDFATSLNQSTDLEVKKRRIWLINALLDFNRQAKVVEDNIERFCDIYGVVLEDDQPIWERQKIHKQLDDLTKIYRSVFEAAKELYNGLSLKH